MEATRIRLAEGVYLTHLPARKFKTSLLSAQFLTRIAAETAAAQALLPAVLRRGTVRYPDMSLVVKGTTSTQPGRAFSATSSGV